MEEPIMRGESLYAFRMSGRVLLVAIAAALALALGGPACGHASSGSGFPAGAGSGDGGDQGSASSPSSSGGGFDGGCLSCGDAGMTGGIVITPANVTLTVTVGGAVPAQGFKATYQGADVTGKVQWTYTRPDVGTLSGSVFTPTGSTGGVGTLTATAGKISGTTSVAVLLEKTIAGGLPAGQQQSLDNPTGGADPSMTLVYPYDQTVFPLAVLSPEVQWDGALAGDVYRLELKEKYCDYVEYFASPPAPTSHLMAETDWQLVESSGSGPKSDPLTVSLNRLSSGTAYQPVTETWHIAQGRLHGAVYYWELPGSGSCNNGADGRVLRIRPDATQVDQFYQDPSGNCFGCHSVSRDGRTMMATWSEGVPFPQQTIDLSQDPSVLGSISAQNGSNLIGTFSAWNPRGDKILVSNNMYGGGNSNGPIASQATLNIVDSTSGAVVTNAAMPAGCGEPAWSPDGAHIAGVCGMDNGGPQGWTFDSGTGNLTIADVAADGATVSNVRTIVPQGSPGRPAYPSFSPDSQWIAFGRPTKGARSDEPGDLWLTSLDGTQIKRLAAASGSANGYNPVFAPLRAGGYSWIVMMSRRSYGNQLVGADMQQLWIAAIDDPPTATDPSHPPFYMRGQEMCARSENAYYALDPCKPTGGTCTSGVDCCGGQCIDNGNGTMTCGTSTGCSALGNACKTASDCCDAGVQCTDGFCQTQPVQ